jgi:hypothetical protein
LCKAVRSTWREESAPRAGNDRSPHLRMVSVILGEA